ncbi:MAG: NADPH-dependent FMN reductase, partial [Planctomycetota bacterium]
FAGSLRTDSFNHALVTFAAERARAAGAEVEVLRLRDLDLPILDEDWERENGLPPGAVELKAKLAAADGILIASPEYNGAPSAALKNAIDWCTRTAEPNETPLVAFRGKVAGIMAASPGGLGGLRGLFHLRTILSGIGVLVVAEQHAVGAAHQTLGPDGRPTDDRNADAVETVVQRVIEVAGALKSES